ncbi:hypothetical protein FRC03_012011 [Tulasnella sp. 419]|nr:hypothetical protein FRC03_012011 [Tulasnella sp. 419]
MVQSWPDMRYLSLNEEVVYNDETGAPPGLDLTDLTFFTEFPQLQVLGVFLWIGGDFKAIKARPSRKFSELQTLHVGTSAIPGEASINEVAIFVASLMSNKDMEISRDTSQWFPDLDFQDEDNEQWDEVSRLMTQYYTAQRSLHQNLDDTIRRLNQEKAARILSEEQCHALEAELKVQRELVSDLTARQRELEQELAGLKANLPSQE